MHRSAAAAERVEHDIAFVGGSGNDPLKQGEWLLRWVA
jgi:hypothetical protein